MNLIKQIDDSIIDDIAQPLVNLAASLSRPVSKYWLARIFLAASIVSFLAIPIPILKLSLLSFVIPTGVGISVREKINARKPESAMSNDRIKIAGARHIVLVISAFLLLDTFAISFVDKPATIVSMWAFVTYFVSGVMPLYIMSCEDGGMRWRPAASNKVSLVS